MPNKPLGNSPRPTSNSQAAAGRRCCREEQGLSLIEATIILMVLSVLTAVTAPAIRGYMLDAQRTEAKSEVEAIASALSRMLVDVGESFFLRNAAKTATTDVLAHGTPSHDTVTTPNQVEMLVSDGRTPTVAAAFVRGSGTDWHSAANDAAIQDIDYYLVLNTPSNLAANAYRTATTMNGTLGFDPDDGQTYNSEFAWRGAYLPGPIAADPWGNRYAANVEFLARAIGGVAGQVNDVFVISAGSNGVIETAFAVDGVTTGNDILAVVSGGTR
jgi:Tfp pilus assembly protein PilE